MLSGSLAFGIEGGILVQVFCNEDVRDGIFDALELANAEALALPEIGPTQSFAPLRHVGRAN